MLLQAFDLLNAGQEQEALALFRQLADRNDPAALATLAELTWSGSLIPRDLAAGRALYHRAGEAGHVASATYATNLLASGRAGVRDWGEAMRRLSREAVSDPQRAETIALLAAMDLTDNGDPRTVTEGRRVSDAPYVMLFPGALSPAECDYVVRLAEPNFEPARVIDEATGRERLDPVRTSHASHLHWLIEDPVIHALNRRIARLSNSEAEQGEPLQILRYRPGQQYRRHVDFIQGSDNQRIRTALAYLNEGYGGGETVFTRVGLTIKGGLGDVLVFHNAGEDGVVDMLSEHAGLPVTEGEKLIASRWIRTRPHQT